MQAFLQQRLVYHQIADTQFTAPTEVAAWLVGLQAQDYTQATWALGVRLPGATEATIGQAFANGSIVRTWLFRGTLHITTAADVRWLLTLLAPRLLANLSALRRQLALDEATLRQCESVLLHALRDGQRRSRAELSAALAEAGIVASGPRLLHIIQWAALNQLLCIGPRRDREETFTLMDAWVPPAPPKSQEEALTELARRYFISHGPATLADFGWWSGLAATEARAGLAAATPLLHRQQWDGQEYWGPEPTQLFVAPSVHLLPGFDEYFLGYKNRHLFIDAQHMGRVASPNAIFSPIIVVDGRVMGTWKRTLQARKVLVKTTLFEAVTADTTDAIAVAAHQYSQFVQRPLELR